MTPLFGPIHSNIIASDFCQNCLEDVKAEQNCQYCQIPICDSPRCQDKDNSAHNEKECKFLQLVASELEGSEVGIRSILLSLILPFRFLWMRDSNSDKWDRYR